MSVDKKRALISQSSKLSITCQCTLLGLSRSTQYYKAHSIFLKSPKRIEALMMVMTLCLLVYNIAQYKLRTALEEKNETLPNQLGKPVKNPTLRWVFQIMEGISIVRFYNSGCELMEEIIANLSDLRKNIIRFFGRTAMKMYGLIGT